MDDTVATDESLVVQYALTRDAKLVDDLVQRHWAPTYRLAHRILGDPGAAEDVAQEAFVALLRGARTFDPSRKFAPWFQGLVVNAARMHGRSRRARIRRERIASETRQGGSAPPRGEERLLASELAEHLERLPIEVREAVVLHYLEGCSQDEVATVLGCPRTTVTTRIARGLERLRVSLAGAGAALSVVAVEEWLSRARVASGRELVPAAPRGVELVARASATKLGAAALAKVAALAIPAAVLASAGVLGLAPRLGVVPAAPGVASAGGPAGRVPAPATGAPPPGKAPVPGASGGGAGTERSPATIPVGNPPGTTETTPDVPATTRLAVVVTDRDGNPVPGARVVAQPTEAKGPGARWYGVIGQLTPIGDGGTLTDGSGRAQLDAASVPAGQSAFVYAAKDGRRGFLGPVAPSASPVASRAITLREATDPSPGTGTVLVTVTAGGSPIAAATVDTFFEWTKPGAKRPSVEFNQEVEAREGVLALRDLEPGKVWIAVSVPGHFPADLSLDLAAGAVERRVLALADELVLEGRILGPSGAPLPGANVSWKRLEAKTESRIAPDNHIESGAGGSYRFGSLDAGKYRVTATAPGFAARSAQVETEHAGSLAVPDLSLGVGAAVSGRVVGPDQSPQADMAVSLALGDEEVASTRTDGAGRFTVRGVAPGDYVLSIKPKEDAPEGTPHGGVMTIPLRRSRPSAVHVKVGPDGADQDVGDVALQAKPVLNGHVVARDGTPVGGAKVTLTAGGPFETPAQPAETDAAGGFRFELPDGDFGLSVSASKDGWASRSVPVNAKEPGEVTLRLETQLGAVVGRVTGPEELVRAGLELEVDPLAEGDQGASTTVGRDGTFRVPAVAAGEARYRLSGVLGSSQVSYYGPDTVTIVAGQETRVSVALASATARIEVKVVDAPEGARIASTDLFWTSHGSAPGGTSRPRSGSGRCEGVCVGPCMLHASLTLKGGLVSIDQPVDAAAGPSTLELRWPTAQLGSLAGSLAPGSPKCSTVMLEAPNVSVLVDVAGDGSFHFDGIPAGHYLAHGMDAGVQPEKPCGVAVDVSAGQTTTVTGVPVGER
jgi:RNA polymerase sigma-70 factor (ECF subfamily)